MTLESTENETQEQELKETPSQAPGVVVIKAQNPTDDEMAALIASLTEHLGEGVTVAASTYTFKKSKDKDTGVITDRKPVILAVPYVNMAGLIGIIEAGGKGLELLLEATATIINTQVRNVLLKPHPDFDSLDASNFPVEEASWDFIAAIPKAQRGGGIPKEMWDAFAADYILSMPALSGRSLDKVTRMAKVLTDKLSKVRSKENVLRLVIQQLGVYTEGSENAFKHADCIAALLEKAEMYLNVDDSELLDAL